jgi:hypothetical protein
MTQPPYRPSDDRATRRLAIFGAIFLIIVAIGAQPRRVEAASQSICVCIPSRAGLLLKSAIVKTKAHSTALLTSTVSLIQ